MGIVVADPRVHRPPDFSPSQAQISSDANMLEEFGNLSSKTCEVPHFESTHMDDVESYRPRRSTSPSEVYRMLSESGSTSRQSTPPSPRPTQSEFSGTGKVRVYDGWTPESPRPESSSVFSRRLEDDMEDLRIEEPFLLPPPNILPNKDKGKARATCSDDDEMQSYVFPDDGRGAKRARVWTADDDEEMDLRFALEASMLDSRVHAQRCEENSSSQSPKQQDEARGHMSSNATASCSNAFDEDASLAWTADEAKQSVTYHSCGQVRSRRLELSCGPDDADCCRWT